MNLVVNAFSRLVLRRAGLITLIGTALSAAGVYYSALLYMNLRTDLEELLPTNARSVIDVNEVTKRLESIDNLAILIRSEDTKASKRFVDELAAKLQLAPKTTIYSVEYRIDKELKFFNDRRALYMDASDLKRIRDYIRDRVQYEKELYNPLNIFRDDDLIPEPKLDFQALKMKYEKQTSGYARFPGGYYATPDEKKRVILAYMPGKVAGAEGIYRLKGFVAKTVAELNPKSYAADLQVDYTGGVQMTIEEQDALVADLELSTIITMILCAVAMIFFYSSFRGATALMIALLMGCVWTFGLSYFTVGYLNANSAFLGAIIIGNGINFGVILLARYFEELRGGRTHEQAVDISLRGTATATLTAAMAAGLSYGSLILTDFRGFRQFGIIGLVGMVLCWGATYIMLPSVLTLMHRRRPLVKPGAKNKRSWVGVFTANAVQRVPALVLLVSVVLTAISLVLVSRIDDKFIETDLSKLRNKHSIEHGAGYLSKHIDEIFQRYLSPMAILAHSPEDALKMAALLKKKKEEEGPKSLIASVQTLDDFVPKDQALKIKYLRDIKRALPEQILDRLPPEERKRADELLNPASFRPISTRDLPQLLLSKFTEKDGSLGKLVLVEPPLAGETLNGNNLVKFITALRAVADEVSPGAPVAGGMAISADMVVAIGRDGPRATMFAFIAVTLLVIILFHNLRTIAIAVTALVLGVLWLFGFIVGSGTKINFLNFIALPITFGIGVDYGVNIFQRFRQEGPASILNVIRETGGAVALCSLTTMIGYGSLLIAENQGFVSFGLLAVTGEITCLIAAIFTLPALIVLQLKKSGRMSEDSSHTHDAFVTLGK